MMELVLRLLLNAAALFVAMRLVSGITYTGGWVGFLGVALVFGVVNAFVKPVLTFFSIPFILLTLGLFLLVVNAFALWITSGLSNALGLGFKVDGFGAAFLGAVVVSLVNLLLSWLAGRPG
ncbi:MAG TPA: phage holin family protein [Anaeromyxobacteraceae bacterium]|nr:phage holin family protein [Anaeromyxobacteraceae bacterium]